MKIVLNEKLTLLPRASYRYEFAANHLREQTIPPEAAAKTSFENGGYTTVPGTEDSIASSFGDDCGRYHRNYLDYLVTAYAVHFKIVMTPDIIWHTILCEITGAVAADADRYESLFTTTPGAKQDIVLAVGAADDMIPVDELVAELRNRVPCDADAFLPEFTTTCDLARFTRQTAFADICSPYYNYATCMCGFPEIDVRGTVDDWERIVAHGDKLSALFASVGGDALVSYLARVRPIVERIIAVLKGEDDGVDFFNGMLTTRTCGSGGEIEVDGWWARSMYVKPVLKEKPRNTPSHISRIVWTNIDTGRKFSLNCGLLTSDIEDGYMIPQWGWVKNEIANPQGENAIDLLIVQGIEQVFGEITKGVGVK